MQLALETHYCKYLQSIGFKTQIFCTSNHFGNSFLNKVRNRLNDSSIYNDVNKELLKECNLKKPKNTLGYLKE